MRITKEALECVSIDLSSLTQRETEAILSGAEPSAQTIQLLGGGKESDDSVRRRYAISTRNGAEQRFRSGCVLSNEQFAVQSCIEKLDTFIANLSQAVES